ncbi:MAG TPA: GGDEF domain-containing protein, partial [Rhodospirillaceae bacterium]|nr:GGDEF domain-containing protein [Rhodospirillaceae bacterium]
TDITLRKAAEDEIKYLAFYDPLTRLPNRRLLDDRMRQALAASARSRRIGALMFIDLDKFKTLNDTFGHEVGDQLLQQVGERLVTCVREGDTVTRLGGDEFVVMLENLSADVLEATAQVAGVGAKILDAFDQPYLIAGHEQRSTPSIGVALFGHQKDSLEKLLKQADIAMYEAKAAGRNTIRFYSPNMRQG